MEGVGLAVEVEVPPPTHDVATISASTTSAVDRFNTSESRRRPRVQLLVQKWTITSMTLNTLLLILAFVAFLIAAIGWSYKKTDLIAIGLALWSFAGLIGTFSHLTLETLLLLLAFVAFVAAAIGWGYKKVSLIAVGLALWVLAQFIGIFIK